MHNLTTDIREYVKRGGRDAFAFSLTYEPLHGEYPGREIQRLIDAEVERQEGDSI